LDHRRPFEPDPDNAGGGKNMSEKTFETKVLAEIVVVAALSAALYSITLPFLTLPYGGSITAGSMIPVLWISLRRGVRVGLFAGLIFGLVALPIDIIRLPYSPIAPNPISLLFDYPIAFGVLGLAALFKTRPLVGVTVASILKFIAHFISGVAFWYMFAPIDPVLWSAIYNGSFMTGEYIISIILMYIIVKKELLKIYL
jgi:thiamine transporter